jgi:hypothetical protein
MDKLTFKNYPPLILTILFCIIVALNFGFQNLWGVLIKHENLNLKKEIICIFTSYGIVVSVMTYVNNKIMWSWLLRVLNLCDVRGTYKGKLRSSFPVSDQSKANMEIFCTLKIFQNLNGLKIKGEFFSDAMNKKKVSESVSTWEEIKKNEEGNYEIRYFYANKGNPTHPYEKKYKLTSHDGCAVLTYYPASRKLKGYYFTYERSSNGRMELEFQHKTNI